MGIGGQSAIAQSLRPESVSALVYQRFPDFPKENQYTRQETGESDPDNTLVTRLIRYHEDVKKRPPRFRLDWKLTLADYLGVNEPMKPERYPGNSTLSVNPMDSDIKAIRSLDRARRTALVDFLADLYQPKEETVSTPKPPSQSPTPQRPATPSLSQPGDAQLLMP